MGSGLPKPEFESVLADQKVKAGDEVILLCTANTPDVTATWEKGGHRLQCVEGKHSINKYGRKHELKISNAGKEDEANYTLTLNNGYESESCSAMITVELNEWRRVQWDQDLMIKNLDNFRMKNEDVKELRFLLHGPIGAGKSSIINTIKSIFEGHQYINCLAASSESSGTSFSVKYQKFTVGSGQCGHLPFAFYDVMGLEQGQSRGVQTDDIINALKGHIPDNHEFKMNHAMTEDNKNYISSPTLNDKIHCLVSVVAADKITLMDDDVIEKMKTIRMEASNLGIPQVLFMTRVDKVCELTQQDLRKIFQSKKIKDKMQGCSNRLGVTMNCIFPVMNCHEGTNPDEKINCLMLDAFKQIVHSAHDYVKRCSDTKKRVK